MQIVSERSRAAAAALPPPAIVEHAVLGRMLPRGPSLVHCFEAYAPGADLGLLRSVPGKGLVEAVSVRPLATDAEESRFIAGTSIYAGTFFGHFGHMVADGIHRLWGALLPGMEDARIVFQVGAAAPTAPRWFEALLGLFGISPDRIVYNNQVTRYERLVVPHQGSAYIGTVLLDRYLDIFPLQAIAAGPARQPPIYLSRGRQTDTGSYLGEHLVERILATAGFEILIPEEMALDILVSKLVAADVIVVSEGSAIHNLELCGRLNGSVYLIGRRSGTKNFRSLLETLCREWAIYKPGDQRFSLDWSGKTNRQSISRNCTFLDLPAMLTQLAKFSGRALTIPDTETIRREVSLDLVTYLMQPGAGARSSDEQLGASLRIMRGLTGLQQLLEVA